VSVQVTLQGRPDEVNKVLLHMLDQLMVWKPELTSITDADERGGSRRAEFTNSDPMEDN